MKKVLLPILFCFLLSNAFAWGPTGHRVTGCVAEKYLNKKAKKRLARILGGHSLAMVSTWMDEIKSDSTFDYTSDWHWVTIPDGMTYDQSEKNPNGDVIATLERLIAELKSGKLSKDQEVQHIKMVVHLIGDIHQPLHVGGGNDRGGNDVKVMWFRVDSNLHRVWDSDMIDDTRLSYTELAQSLVPPAKPVLDEWRKTTVRDWANESMAIRRAAYDYDRTRLGYEYSFHKLHLVRERLLKAGVRIASVLNEIYGS
jgi:S1/P1 Nuclease.